MSVRGEVPHRGGPPRAALWQGLETVPQPGALLVVAVRTPDGGLPLLRSAEDNGTANPSPTPQRSLAGLLIRVSGEPHRACLPFWEVCGRMIERSLPARRPSAGIWPASGA